jgi:hypothetical protein
MLLCENKGEICGEVRTGRHKKRKSETSDCHNWNTAFLTCEFLNIEIASEGCQNTCQNTNREHHIKDLGKQ